MFLHFLPVLVLTHYVPSLQTALKQDPGCLRCATDGVPCLTFAHRRGKCAYCTSRKAKCSLDRARSVDPPADQMEVVPADTATQPVPTSNVGASSSSTLQDRPSLVITAEGLPRIGPSPACAMLVTNTDVPRVPSPPVPPMANAIRSLQDLHDGMWPVSSLSPFFPSLSNFADSV